MNQMYMNPMYMNQMNPMYMNQMNPMYMNQMNPMYMNQMNPMYMNQMSMNNPNLDEIKKMIGEEGINKMNLDIGNTSWMETMNPTLVKWKLSMMNQQQKEEYKKWLKLIGYKIGKLAGEKKKKEQGKNTDSSETNIAPEKPKNGEITVKFDKGGNITSIKMKTEEMVASLIYEYFEKSKTTTGKFNFNGRELTPNNCEDLNTAGLTDGCTIIVS